MVFAVSVTTKRTVDAVALDAALLHHAADAEGAALRRFVRRDLRGVKKNTRFSWNAHQHQRGGDAERRHAAGDRGDALMTGFHVLGFTFHQQNDFDREAARK